MNRVCLVGAGFIANVHAESIAGLPNLSLAAVVDPRLDAGRRFARRWHIEHVYVSVDEALAADRFDRAHVLTPPDRHLETALPLLRAGKAVLVEKPLAASVTECDALIEAAARPNRLGINQNFVYHPAFVRLRHAVERRMLGNPQHVDVLYNVPLRQLESRQFGHWMFRAPGNLLLEQAIHPLSQLVSLCGPVEELRALGGSRNEIAPGVEFVPSFSASFRCSTLPANMHFAVGRTFPAWQLRVVCDDGVMTADMMAGRCWTERRTRWLPPIDGFLSGQRTALEIARDSGAGLLGYGLSTLKLTGRCDGFFRSMSGSVRTFHKAIDNSEAPPLDGGFGRSLVEICERLRDEITVPTREMRAPPAPGIRRARAPDVAVLGGTGFIGRHVVSALIGTGRTVSVLARGTTNLPAEFGSESVQLHSGDIRYRQDVAGAIDGASAVINLAHGGGGANWEAIRDAMVGGAEGVAQACLAAGTGRLVHVGSIASLYLGAQRAPVTGSTPPDPKERKRAHYARAKVLCDDLLLKMHERDGLPVCILRPGLVVGSGTSPLHSGLGFFNNEQHCIGWNRGRNPLPFVLVDDVVAAILTALRAPAAIGRCYNLVGDVRPTARQYVDALAQSLQRPLRYHPKMPLSLYVEEIGKWGLKRLGGRSANSPSLRDLKSRGLRAAFDCTDAKRDLGWQPVSDWETFAKRAFGLQRRAS